MLFIRLSMFKHYTLLTTSISLNGEIVSPYSCYIKKGLVYIAIADPSSCQPSFCIKYTKSNMRLFCDVRLVSNAKYTCLIHSYIL